MTHTYVSLSGKGFLKLVPSPALPPQELTLIEDATRATHTVNPLMVHVVVEEGGQGPVSRRSSLQTSSLAQVIM